MIICCRSIPIAIIVSLVICLTAYVSVTLMLTLMVPYNEIHGDSALIDMFVQNGAGGEHLNYLRTSYH